MSTVEWLIAITLITLIIALGASLYEKAPIEPVATVKLKVEEWTCLKDKAGECLKWEVKEVYRDQP